jgi:oxygen-independent coproporphyrinogen-3 oxidase
VVTGTSEAKRVYLGALDRELTAGLPYLKESLKESLGDCRISSIYLGGGSPSVMRPDDVATMMRRFIKRLRDENLVVERGLEVSIECMPQTIGTPSLSGLRSGGFTRYSLSMQSIIPSELEALDCDFSVRDIQNAVLFLEKFHIHNVNLDLMYGNPLQTFASWKQTLRAARDFEPEHISLYPFPGLPESCRLTSGQTGVEGYPDTAEAAEILERLERLERLEFARGFLSGLGYTQYTRYHFAKPHRQCRYFLERYRGEDYLGFGLGARSLVGGVSYANTNDWDTYLEHSGNFERIVTDVIRLNPAQQDAYQKASQALLM